MAGATQHCGQMSESTSRLVEVITLFERLITKAPVERGESIETASDTVQDMRLRSLQLLVGLDVSMKAEFERAQKELADIQARCHDDFQEMQLRHRRRFEDAYTLTQVALDHLRARTTNDTDEILQRIQARTSTKQGNEDVGFLLQQMKEYSSDVVRDVKSAQNTLMHTQTQLLGFNSWSFAWAEAMRLARYTQRDATQPPNYEQAGPATSGASLLDQVRTANLVRTAADGGGNHRTRQRHDPLQSPPSTARATPD
ncbi:hypothetical protein CF319_g8476 [Tilletia indica]|uniref:Uncharacterized protein n=1 Tax=Tilletia indica TaxID=43049 RepID=A0A177T948_9BASI|nr:hypothetical protein CF319_g8476 [Tilletia indica]KAE8242623.1 hypothetical protein A4X13_0g7083 [Tilletia indica]